MAHGASQIDWVQDLSIDRWDRERASSIGRRKLLQAMNMRVLAVAGVVGLRCGIAWRGFKIEGAMTLDSKSRKISTFW